MTRPASPSSTISGNIIIYQQLSYHIVPSFLTVPSIRRYNDGVQWHDVPCFFRGRIICEDSEAQMARVLRERGVDVTVPDNSSLHLQPAGTDSPVIY
jgi:hypothetical protein